MATTTTTQAVNTITRITPQQKQQQHIHRTKIIMRCIVVKSKLNNNVFTMCPVVLADPPPIQQESFSQKQNLMKEISKHMVVDDESVKGVSVTIHSLSHSHSHSCKLSTHVRTVAMVPNMKVLQME